MSSQKEILIRIQPTPNPFAWKFILDTLVLATGKASFTSVDQAKQHPLADAIFKVPGVKQVHLFQNVITVTYHFDCDIEEVHALIGQVLQKNIPENNPNWSEPESPKKIRQAPLSEDEIKIEEILNKAIRPALQADGGDIEIVKYENNELYLLYQGACGTCPSATTGTLMAIESTLRAELQKDITVIPVEL